MRLATLGGYSAELVPALETSGDHDYGAPVAVDLCDGRPAAPAPLTPSQEQAARDLDDNAIRAAFDRASPWCLACASIPCKCGRDQRWP